MNKIFKLFMLAAVVLGFSSCYNEFEEPAPAKVWTKADFADSKLISIKDFKQLFYDKYGNGASSLGKTLEVTEDYVISGKVISSDQAGNVYKSVYISLCQDQRIGYRKLSLYVKCRRNANS